jgi:hypothetical protein
MYKGYQELELRISEFFTWLFGEEVMIKNSIENALFAGFLMLFVCSSLGFLLSYLFEEDKLKQQNNKTTRGK